MANFDLAFAKIMKTEGGFVNDPTDSGGYTYCGVTKKNFPKWAGWVKLAAWVKIHGQPKTGKVFTEAEMPGITNDLKSFYIENFWKPIGGDNINDQDLAEQVFNMAENAGVHAALTLLKEAQA